MNQSKLTVVSADCHAGAEHMADYRSFVDPAIRGDFDDYCAAIDSFNAKSGGDLTAGGAPSDEEDGLWDPVVRTDRLDADGIAAEVIFAQGSVPFGAYPAVGGGEKLNFPVTPELSAAGCRAYNRWLAEFCSHDNRRHLGIARVSLDDIPSAVKEVEDAAKAGLRGGIHLPPLISNTAVPLFNDPVYEPLWNACAANQMALNMHGGSGIDYGNAPGAGLINLAEVDWFAHRGLSHLIFGGAFERNPTLHLAITEQRTHWVKQLLYELDSIYALTQKASFIQGGMLKKKPSEYFRSNCFVGASFMSRPECEQRGELGADCYMWGSDYPHNEGAWPYTTQALRYTFGTGVPLAEIRSMLGANAIRCYYLDADELAPLAQRMGPSVEDIQVAIDLLPGEAPGDPEVRSWAFRRHGPWH